MNEGGEGIRFVRVNIYDCLLNWDAAQGTARRTPIPTRVLMDALRQP